MSRFVSNMMRARSSGAGGRYKKISHKEYQAQKLRQLAVRVEKQQRKLELRKRKLLEQANQLDGGI